MAGLDPALNLQEFSLRGSDAHGWHARVEDLSCGMGGRRAGVEGWVSELWGERRLYRLRLTAHGWHDGSGLDSGLHVLDTSEAVGTELFIGGLLRARRARGVLFGGWAVLRCNSVDLPGG